MYVGAIDQGTTSTRFVVVGSQGGIVAMDQQEHRQIYPQPGWVEHDALEIWQRTEQVIAAALQKADIAATELSAVGIANQRETTVLWDAASGVPVAPAIVWQDTRTDGLVRDLGGAIGQDRFRIETGLPLATYFSGPKARWLIDHHGLRDRAETGEILFGTIDTWLIWKLTGRHVTDVTNASRTLLMNLAQLDWDEDLCEAVGVPRAMLPEILPSVATYGTAQGVLEGVVIAGDLGDQQAALFGQTCFDPGTAKNTYGTGCFMLLNTGTVRAPSEHGLLTTVAYQVEGEAPVFALEGSVAIAGAGVQWLSDNLGIISGADEVEELASGVTDNGDVYFVPAFSGLFAPHWRADARGVIVGLTGFADKRHIARAVLESVAYQTRDVLQAMEADSGEKLSTLYVDGGMVANDLLMQFQADILDVSVARPVNIETTALGAAYAAGLAVGYFDGFDHLRSLWSEDRRWEPAMEAPERDRLYASWGKAVQRTLDWVE
jgi:glycerol kinase